MEKRHIGIAAGLIKRAGHVDEGLPSLVSHVTFGSFTLEPRDGNKEPVYWFDEATGMSLNAVELKNQGIEDFLWNDLPMLEHLPRAGCEVRISLAPLKSGDLAEMIRVLFRYQLTNPVVSEIEVNAACPNHKDESGRLHDVLAHDPNALNELMSEAMEYRGPKAIKIAQIGRAHV